MNRLQSLVFLSGKRGARIFTTDPIKIHCTVNSGIVDCSTSNGHRSRSWTILSMLREKGPNRQWTDSAHEMGSPRHANQPRGTYRCSSSFNNENNDISYEHLNSKRLLNVVRLVKCCVWINRFQILMTTNLRLQLFIWNEWSLCFVGQLSSSCGAKSFTIDIDTLIRIPK